LSKRKNSNNIIELSDGTEKKPQRIKATELKTFEPLTTNQQLFFEAYGRGDYFVMLCGSAGTGKSFIALYQAIKEVLDRESYFKKIVIVRSIVPGRDIGFLPGSLEEKQALYELPYEEICQTLFGRKDAYEALKEGGRIRFLTTTSLRGLSLDDSIIIVDEFQNCNWSELNTIMGRIGSRSKIIFCGDYKQNDLTKSNKDVSAFHDFVKVAKNMKSFTEIYFTPEDIVRSNLTKEWIISCEELGY
jgi:predicted ribonuclease YlaK